MDEYVQLVLTMIVSYNYWGDELKFNKSDIDNLIKEHEILKECHWNERASIILWKEGYIDNERFAKLMDLEYEDKIFWMTFNSFDDMLGKDYEFESSFLDGEYDWNYGNFYDVDVEQYFDEYTPETLQDIINFCDKHGCEIDGDEETIVITKENTKLIDGEIIINGNIKLVDVLNELDELKTCLNGSICEAQESADYSEVYTKVKNAFVEKIGEFKHKTVKVKDKNVEKIYIKFDDFSEAEESLKESYGDYEFVEENFGSLFNILKDMEYFKFRKPDYDHIYGDIDKGTLNEYTQNRLGWD